MHTHLVMYRHLLGIVHPGVARDRLVLNEEVRIRAVARHCRTARRVPHAVLLRQRVVQPWQTLDQRVVRLLALRYQTSVNAKKQKHNS